MSPAPFRCEPFLRPMVWGGRRLGERLHKPLPTAEPYGESWEISDHALHRSRVAVGPWQGKTLHEVWIEESANHGVFPWLIKFLDGHDWLSVQVHPDDQAVQRLRPGERGKTEAWFILAAAADARIFAGLKPGVDEKTLRHALAAGTVADCLHSFVPRPGDCVFLPAGTVHAVGGGVLMAEVQQTSDATFRLFDWNRRDAQGRTRQLHIEESLKAIHWEYGPVQPLHAAGFEAAGPSRQELCACPYFRLEYLACDRPFELGGTGRLQAFVVLEGAGTLLAPWSAEPVETGQAWIVPAAAAPTTWIPRNRLGGLVCTLPA